MIIRSGLLNASILGAGLLLPAAAAADECGIYAPPSPGTDFETGISFYNDTQFAFRVWWSNHDGVLVEYALVQPGEETGFQTYIGHEWYLEAYRPEGAVCLGPLSAYDVQTCEVRLHHSDASYRFGFETRWCND